MTRGAARRKELAIRAALGAGRARLVRYLLIESLLLSLAGGALGALVAAWVVDLLPAITAVDVPRIGETAINVRVLAAAFAMSVLTGVLCGTIPALRASRASLTDALNEGARATGGVPAGIAGALALSEIALALVLLIGAALMIQSVVFLSRVNPGFNARNVVTTPIALPGVRYARPEQRVAFIEDLAARLRGMPHAVAAGGVSHLPLAPGDNRMGFDIEGRPAVRPGDERRASLRVVAGDYFRAMEIPIVRGRAFTAADARRAVPLIRWFEQQPLPPGFDQPQPRPVAMINETMARQFWPGEDPIGKRLRILFSPAIEIIGVVGDVRHAGLARDPVPEMYLSHLQEPQAELHVLVRSSGDPAATSAMLAAQIRGMDRDLPLPAVRAMEEVVRTSIGRPRFDAVLLRDIRRCRAAALRDWHLWSHVVRRRPADPRDRHSGGARRRSWRRAGPGARTGDPSHDAWHRHRARRRAGVDAGPDLTPLWGATDRSRHVRRGRDDAVGGRAAGQLSAGPARPRRRSIARASDGVKRARQLPTPNSQGDFGSNKRVKGRRPARWRSITSFFE